MKIIVQIMILAVAISPVYAQLGSQYFPKVHFNDTNFTDVEMGMAEAAFSNPGILPDNPFYFLKKFAEGTRLLFAFDQKEKAKLHMEFAKTRLAEAYRLMDTDKNSIVADTLKDYKKELNELENSVNNTENVSAVVNESVKMLEKGALFISFEMQKAPVTTRGALENALKESIEKKAHLETKNNASENNIKNRIKDDTEKNLQIQKEIKNRYEKAEDGIRNTTEKLNELMDKINKTNNTEINVTAASELLLQAGKKVSEAQDAFNATNFGKAIELSNAAEHLTKDAEKVIEINDEKEKSHLDYEEIKDEQEQQNKTD